MQVIISSLDTWLRRTRRSDLVSYDFSPWNGLTAPKLADGPEINFDKEHSTWLFYPGISEIPWSEKYQTETVSTKAREKHLQCSRLQKCARVRWSETRISAFAESRIGPLLLFQFSQLPGQQPTSRSRRTRSLLLSGAPNIDATWRSIIMCTLAKITWLPAPEHPLLPLRHLPQRDPPTWGGTTRRYNRCKMKLQTSGNGLKESRDCIR